jgi:hypothetical protein
MRAAKLLPRPIRHAIRMAWPNAYAFNYLLARRCFVEGNGRPPRPLSARNATINDYIFDRMLRDDWTPLERLCVDKERAKAFARDYSGVRVPETHAVLSVRDDTTLEALEQWVRPFIGRRLVLKPTHASGRVLFLDEAPGREQLAELLAFSKRSFFHKARETQYRGLARKLLIEENISDDDNPVDYKFFCARGRAIYCEVNVDRFTHHKCAVCELPDLRMIEVSYVDPRPDRVDRPENLADLIAFAEKLSTPFDFVRVDLYSVRGEVYFGEFTFTPCAGSAPISDEAWAIDILARLRAIYAETNAPNRHPGNGKAVIRDLRTRAATP